MRTAIATKFVAWEVPSLENLQGSEEKAYKKIPVITDFTDGDGNDRMKETVQANYRRIKEEVKQIVQEELERIANDENLKHLLQQK